MSESTSEAETHSPPPASPGLSFPAKVVGGFVVVGVVVGLGLLAQELGDDGLELPEQVGGVDAADSDAGLESAGADDPDRLRDALRRAYDYNSGQLSRAFDEAEAVTRRYGVPDGEWFLVTAVRAETGPPLPATFEDPRVQGVAVPRAEIHEEGDVVCLLTRSSPPPANRTPTEKELAPTGVLCQRSGGDLTVRVYGGNRPDLDRVVDATEEVWDELA